MNRLSAGGVLLAVLSAGADVVTLQSGVRVEGTIVSEDEESLRIQGRSRVHWLKRSAVRFVEPGPPSWDLYARKAAELEADRAADAAAHCALAAWCAERGLSAERDAQYARALDRDADCAEARRALSWVREGNGWARPLVPWARAWADEDASWLRGGAGCEAAMERARAREAAAAAWLSSAGGPRARELERDLRAAILTADEGDRRARARSLATAGVPFEVFELLARRVRLPDLPPEAAFEFTIAASGATTACHVAAPRGVPDSAKLPLLLTLHTTSEPAELRCNRFARTLTAAGWIVAAPHSSPNFGKGWGSREVERSVAVSALDALLRRYPVDPDRVFLNGASMGGNGCWEIGMLHRDRFAGLAPSIAGPRIRNFPLLVNLGGLPVLSTIGADEDALMVEANSEAIAFLRDGLDSPARLHAEPRWGHVEKPELWDPRLVEWGSEIGRSVYPRGLVHHFALESHSRHHWIRAERTGAGVVDPTEGKIPVDAKGTEAQRRSEYVAKGRARCARLAARVDGQTIRIATRSVPKVTLWLSDAMVDLSMPVTVEINGKQVFKGTLERSLETLVTEIAVTRDTGRVFATRLTLPK